MTLMRVKREIQEDDHRNPPHYIIGAYTDIPWKSTPPAATTDPGDRASYSQQGTEVSLEQNTFLFALTYERMFQDRWSDDDDDDHEREEDCSEEEDAATQQPPVRKPIRFASTTWRK